MLTEEKLEQILSATPRLRIGVVGDLFLDRYLDLEAALTEPSLETGLDAFQVTRVRSYPGAAGTVINNLAALGVGTIIPIAVIGDDGESYELRQALTRMPAVRHQYLLSRADRRTPTYTKPMLNAPGQAPRELNRLDIKNREPLPVEAENSIITALEEVWPALDALIALDQVSEANCGVITERVRNRLERLGTPSPEKLILADSRERIGLFKNVSVKPNVAEGRKALRQYMAPPEAAVDFAQRSGRTVFYTCGAAGIWVATPQGASTQVPALKVPGPIDPVGAGDSTSAGLACAMAAGADPLEAAAFANIVASITIQQIGTTGTATPAQVRQRWRAQGPPSPGYHGR